MHIIYILGSLPTEIGNLNKLLVLGVGGNHYSGELYIPTLKFLLIIIILEY